MVICRLPSALPKGFQGWLSSLHHAVAQPCGVLVFGGHHPSTDRDAICRC